MRNIINDFIAGKIFGNCHIFINSVDSIAALIKACNLTDDNCRVIFSKNNSKYKNSCQGVTNGETTDPVKKINLYTSTCFEGCDLCDEEGKIYIVSDGAKSQTLYDISTQIRQIAGRIRNTKYSEITHLYKSTRYNEDLTYEQYKSVVLEEEKKAKKKEECLKQQCSLLEAEIAKLKEESANWKNKYYEAYADLDNTRKALQKDHENMLKYRAQGFVENMLQPLDSFDMALRNEPKDEVLKNYLKGFKMIYSQFQKVLADESVTEVDPKVGEPFDATKMHAIQTIKGEQDDLVASVYVKGYYLKDRLIRPAMVVVTKKEIEEEKSDEEKKD